MRGGARLQIADGMELLMLLLLLVINHSLVVLLSLIPFCIASVAAEKSLFSRTDWLIPVLPLLCLGLQLYLPASATVVPRQQMLSLCMPICLSACLCLYFSSLFVLLYLPFSFVPSLWVFLRVSSAFCLSVCLFVCSSRRLKWFWSRWFSDACFARSMNGSVSCLYNCQR